MRKVASVQASARFESGRHHWGYALGMAGSCRKVGDYEPVYDTVYL